MAEAEDAAPAEAVAADGDSSLLSNSSEDKDGNVKDLCLQRDSNAEDSHVEMISNKNAEANAEDFCLQGGSNGEASHVDLINNSAEANLNPVSSSVSSQPEGDSNPEPPQPLNIEANLNPVSSLLISPPFEGDGSDTLTCSPRAGDDNCPPQQDDNCNPVCSSSLIPPSEEDNHNPPSSSLITPSEEDNHGPPSSSLFTPSEEDNHNLLSSSLIPPSEEDNHNPLSSSLLIPPSEEDNHNPLSSSPLIPPSEEDNHNSLSPSLLPPSEEHNHNTMSPALLPPPERVSNGGAPKPEDAGCTATAAPQKRKRKRKRKEAEAAAAAAAQHMLSSGSSSSIRCALRQGARSGSGTYDETLVDELLQKQLGDSSKKKRIFDMAKEVDTEAMIAYSVGFPPDALTEEEIEAGVVSSVGGDEQANYIIVRNHIVSLWREKVTVWLDPSHAMESIRSQHKGLVNSAYSFLLSHGYINFGVAPAIKDAPLTAFASAPGGGANVVIIGAGLAGLAAAQHLLARGFKVIILEARRRPGGRVFSKKMAAQVPGDMVQATADLGGSVITGIHGNPLGVLARQLGFPLHKVRDKCPLYQPDGRPVDAYVDAKVEEAFNRLLDQACQLRQDMDEVTVDVSLGTALETFRHFYGVAEKAEERKLLDWHLANLEYANAALLSKLSLAFWDQDDPYEMGGDHCFLPGGNGRFIQALADGLPIIYDKSVQAIRYGSDGVQVLAGGQVFQGDMVLCTAPLGVLKAGVIKFVPELPQRKIEAIERLGFGLLNKVAMLFPTVFWGTDIDTFGHLCDESSRRGEYFLFYSYASVSGGPLLIALVAGEAAIDFESTPPIDAVERILQILRGIYGPRGVQVPDPLQTVFTRWGSDPFSLGSYSHVAVGASGDDYDILAESVGDGRVFFAGEATNRRYPATMHGAFLSGLREAANISRVASSRSLQHKVDRCLVKDNGNSDGALLADLFKEPDLTFGGFSVLFDPQSSDLNSRSLLRVLVGGNRRKGEEKDVQSEQERQQQQSKLMVGQVQTLSKQAQPQQLQLYSLLTRQQALELHVVRGGDEDRLRYLCEKLGARLVGRKGLGGLGDALIFSLKCARSSQNNVCTTPVPLNFGNQGTQA
ncbi:hypothetical protein SUGI_1115660 [Cryptomeria japonica]|uniref:protein FLOWERING LOCUS D n=1 Tax=Cryptomeria japonica TaxID=3369 RepID=UPI002414B5A2|nr:protein FLOWERING LOCUS D [Cryptomeria japonica]GLJ52457.1 hypothetical protein SUGI_1115660 [Cryptomeria japonica]